MNAIVVLSFLFSSAETVKFNPLDFSTISAGFWTWVIFIASLWPIWHFVFKPITQALDERDSKVEQALQAAEEAQRLANESKQASDAQLAKVQAEGQKILAQAEKNADARGREIVEQAKGEAMKVLERARAEIEQEKTKALFEIREEVVSISIRAAEKVIGRQLADSDTKRFVEEMIQATADTK